MIENFFKLKSDELKKFELFIKSPFHNTNKAIVKFSKYLMIKQSSKKIKDLDNKLIFRYVYRNQKYSSLKCRKLFSDFNIIFAQFLTQIKFESDKTEQSNYLLKGLRDFGDHKKFVFYYKKNKKLNGMTFSKDIDFYRREYMLEKENYVFERMNKSKKIYKNIQRLSDVTNMYSVFLKLWTFFNYDVFRFVVPSKIKIDQSFRNEIFEYIEENINEIKKNHPNIFMLYSIMRLEYSLNEKYFKDAHEYYIKNKRKFKGELLSNYIQISIIRYSGNIGNIEENRIMFVKLVDEFYVKSPRPDFLTDSDKMDFGLFCYAVICGSSLKKFEWVYDFIEKNKKYLPEYIAFDVLNFAKAIISFEKKEFSKSLEYTNKISNKSFDLTYHNRNRKVLIFYELHDYEGIIASLNSISDDLKKRNWDKLISTKIRVFIKFSKRLSALKFEKIKGKEEELLLLKSKIELEKQKFYKKDWFLEKIEELLIEIKN